MVTYNQYKNTDYEWIGEVPEHWQIGSVKHCFKFKVGFTPPTSIDEYYDDEGYEWITISDMDSKIVTSSKTKISSKAVQVYSKDIVPTGSLLYSFKLSVGKVAFAGKDIFTNEAIFSILPDEKLELSYYYYCLPTILIHNANENIYGAKIFNQEVIKNSRLPIPPKEEQARIAAYLDHHIGLIENLIIQRKRLIGLLELKKMSLMSEMVINSQQGGVLRATGIDWMPSIPVNWDVVPIRYLANKVGSGVTPKGGAEVYKEEGVMFIRSQNVHFDGLRLNDVVRIDQSVHRKMAGSIVKWKDVLLNITGASIGRCCVVEIDEEMNVNQHVCIIRPNERLLPEYLNLVLQSHIGQSQIKFRTTGGNREGLTFEAIKNFEIPLPPIDIQSEIVDEIKNAVSTLDDLIVLNRTQIEKLKEYTDSKIWEVVTGKINVQMWESTC